MSEAPKSEHVPKSMLEQNFDHFRERLLDFEEGGPEAPTTYRLLEMENFMILFDMDETDRPFPKLTDTLFDEKKALHGERYEFIAHEFHTDRERDKAIEELEDRLREETIVETAKAIASVIKRRKAIG
jgi:hypothetical protein